MRRQMLACVCLLLAGRCAAAQNGTNTQVQQPIRISGGVLAGTIVSKVSPICPQEAREQHISCTAVTSVIIGTDGAVESAEGISGAPIVLAAYIEAVKQWHYRPYLVDGVPQRIATTVTIVF